MADGLEEAGLRFVAENEDGFKRSMQNAQGAVDNFTGDLAGAQTQRVNGFQAMLTGAFAGITTAAIDMAAQATQAVTGFVTDSIGAANDFAKGQSILQATTGATAEEMKAVSDLSIALGNDLSLPASSAMDANTAILELVKGGMSLEQAMDAAKGTLLLATAAETDAGEAAKVTSSILNAFGLEGKEATRIVDLLAGAAAAGAGEVSDYAQGFQQAGFAFNMTGQDAGDLATALQTLIESGLTGSDAGTALKNAMMRLQNPTAEAAELMERMNISVYDAQGNMKPFPEILGIFNEKMAGMTNEQRDAALGTIFLSDGLKAMSPLLDEGTAKFLERKAAVSESGQAEKLASAQMEGFNGASAALTNTLETLQLVIGTALLPILTDLFNKYIIPGAQWVMNLVQSFLDASASGEDMGATLSGIIPGFDGIMSVVDSLKIMFEGALPAITSVINGIRDVITAVFGEVQKFIDEHGDEIMAVLKDAWEVIQLAIDTAVMYYEKIVAPTLEKIAKWISDHSDEIQAVFKTAWDAIKLAIDTVLTAIKGILTAAMQLMQGDTEGALNTLKTTFETIWNNIKGAIEGIVNNLAQGLRQKFEEIKSGITGAIQGAYDAVKKTLEGWLALGSSIITNIIDGIKSQAQALLNQIKGVVEGAIRAAVNLFPEFLRAPLLAFFGLSGATGQNKNSGASAYTNYGGNVYYNLNVTSMASPNVVMESFAVMQAFAG